MKTLHYLVFLLLGIQPFIHADETLLSCVNGWVSRNISTIGICAAFSALNWYFIKNNTREKSLPVINAENYVTRNEFDQHTQKIDNLMHTMNDQQSQRIKNTCTQLINESFNHTPFHFSERQRDHIKSSYFYNDKAKKIIDEGNNLTRLSFLLYSLHTGHSFRSNKGFETADLNHRKAFKGKNN